ncbi:MAG: SMP-30/gluconolactonase/LRE family protein [Acetobacteraceae bacterium]
MFAPPTSLTTEVFATLPATFRRQRASRWSEANRGGQALDSFLEGPAFDRDGNLYVVDIPFGRLFRISPEGAFAQVAEYDGEPNGLKIHRDGRLFITDYKNGIVLLDPASGAVTPLLDRRWTERFKGVNDLFFAANGDLYFTDQGQTGLHDPTGRVYRLTAGGRLDLLLGTVPSPNGLVMNRDETALLVAATRANAVWRLPLLPDGSTSKVGVFIQLSGGLGGPDGLALDEAGGLAVAHAGLGTVWLFDRLGQPLLRIRSCAGLMTTNVAYGGTDRRTLYITESETGSVLRASLPVAGRPMFSHS